MDYIVEVSAGISSAQVVVVAPNIAIGASKH